MMAKEALEKGGWHCVSQDQVPKDTSNLPPTEAHRGELTCPGPHSGEQNLV